MAAAGCGKYSISNIRSLKAFQDANGSTRRATTRAAVRRYEEAVQLNPDLGFAYFFLGNSYDNLYKPAQEGRAGERRATCTKAVENYRGDRQAQGRPTRRNCKIRKLAYEYLIAAYGADKLNDFEKAEPIAKELIALEPNEPTNYQALGKLYEDQGRYDEAEAQFMKAIEVKPNDPLGYQVLAGYYNRQGDFDKTMEAFEKRARRRAEQPRGLAHDRRLLPGQGLSSDKKLLAKDAAGIRR